jgi:hypothetical protein
MAECNLSIETHLTRTAYEWDVRLDDAHTRESYDWALTNDICDALTAALTALEAQEACY